jgi:hypothetical protein
VRGHSTHRLAALLAGAALAFGGALPRKADGAPPVERGSEPLPDTIISVSFVKENGLPDRIGVCRGDVFLRLGDRQVTREGDSPYVPSGTNIPRLASSLRGRASELEVLRDGELTRLSVPAGAVGERWEMYVVFTRNPLGSVLAGPGVTHEAKRLAAASVRCAARLDWAGAVREAEKVVGAGVNDRDFLGYVAECWNHIPDYGKAKDRSRAALARDPENSRAMRARAYALLFSGEPAEAAAAFGKLRLVHRFDKNDGRGERMARAQLPWVKAAALDAERRKGGVLPDLLNRRTPRRRVPVADLMAAFWPKIWAPNRRGAWGNSIWTADIISSASISAHLEGLSIHRLDPYFKYASFAFMLQRESFHFGVCPNGDGLSRNADDVCRLISLDCIRPGIDGNTMRVVRQGHRSDCFVNGTYVLTYYHSDEPARFYWAVYGLGTKFARMTLEVPDRDAPPPPEEPEVVDEPAREEDYVEEDVF